MVRIESADIQAASSISRELRGALEAVAEQKIPGCRKTVALHPGSHRGAAQQYLSTLKSPVGQKLSKPPLSLETGAEGSLSSCGSSLLAGSQGRWRRNHPMSSADGRR